MTAIRHTSWERLGGSSNSRSCQAGRGVYRLRPYEHALAGELLSRLSNGVL